MTYLEFCKNTRSARLLGHYLIYTVIWKFMIKWLLWEFIPLRFIITKSWEKIRPPINLETGLRPPATFLIWVSGIISIYIAVFSIASQRYEARVDVIENRANSVFSQLSITNIRKETLSRIPSIQIMPCPKKPELFKPITIIESLFFEDMTYPDIVKLMKETLEIWKEHLQGVHLYSVNLKDANLVNANFKDAWLFDPNFKGANLECANFEGANLIGANFEGARLMDANFKGAKLSWANLKGTFLIDANFEGAELRSANLKGANSIPDGIKEKLDKNCIFRPNKQK